MGNEASEGPAATCKEHYGLPAPAYLDTGLADVNGDDLTHGCNPG